MGSKGKNIIGPPPSGPLYDNNEEKQIASKLVDTISAAHLSSLVKFQAGSDPQYIAKSISFEKALVQFALEQRISLKSPEWRDNAILRAAQIHLKSQPNKRRGRPPKSEKLPAGPLSPPSSFEDDVELSYIELIQEIALELRGTTISDARACRIYVKYQSDLYHADPFKGHEPGFAAAVRTLQNKVSRQRKLFHRPKPKPTNLSR